MSDYCPTPDQLREEWTRALGEMRWHVALTPREQRQALRAWAKAREMEDLEQIEAPERRARA